MTTTADSATITAQDRSQSRLEPVHAMNDSVRNTEGPGKRAQRARSPADLQESERTARGSRTGSGE